jgi:NitT/TauT family transport system substrate-binding protein
MPVPKPNKLALIFATMAATFAISSGDATAQRKVTATFVAPTLSQTIPWIGKEAGIFAKHGIDADVILLTGSPRAVQTLLAGDIEYTIAGGQSAIRARMYGADPVMLATSANFSSQRVLLRPESTLQRLQDLKGKTVGVTQYGSGGDTFLRAALRSIGLRPEADVTILQMGGTPQVGSSLIAGKVDAGISGESSVLLIHQGKMKQLPGASAKEMKILSSGAPLITTRRYISRDRRSVMQFMRAYVDGVRYFKTNKEGSVRALQKLLRGATASEIGILYDDQRDVVDPLPVPSDEALQADLDRETDPKARSMKLTDLVDLSFLREIEKSGFLAELYGKGAAAR